MNRIVFFCLLILSVNAVLIQTITEDNAMLKNAIRVGVILLMAFLMVIKKQRLLIGILLLLKVSIISLILGRNIDQLSFVFVFIVIHSLLLFSTQKIEKYLLISSIISLSLVFMFLFLGLTVNEINEYGNRNRMTFGTDGVPFFYNLVYGTFTLLVLYSLKYFNQFKWLIILTSICFTSYFYLMTDARGGYFSFIAFILLLVIIPRTGKSLLKYIIAYIPVIFLGLSLILASLSNNSYANELFSYRPFLLNVFFDNINFTDFLFSTSVKDFGISVDNSYLHLLIGGGIIIFLSISYLFFKAILNLYRLKKYIEISFIVSTCLYFTMESLMVRIENMFVIYFWYLIIKYSLTKVNDKLEKPMDAVSVAKQKRFRKYRIVW